MIESVLSFECEGEALVGILAEPSGSAADVGVLIVVGGPQYRAGSHRQFVLLARHLASHGFAALRFDYRSMGDSTGDARDFLGVDADIQAAVNALMSARQGLKRVVIWGLCDAASAALLYLESRRDDRVAGLALLNPWARSAATLAQTHVKHYYWRRLRDGEFWRKLLSGAVGKQALSGFLSNVRLAQQAGKKSSASFQERMSHGLQKFEGQVLLVLSGNDYTAQEFLLYAQQSATWQPRLKQALRLPTADHTFSSSTDRAAVEAATLDWLKSHLRGMNV